MSNYRFLGGVPVLLLALSAIASANPHAPHGTTRTYFGRPGFGPYGAPEHMAGGHGSYNPWTGKLFGIRCCKTCETVEQDYQRRLAVAQARAQVIVNRVQPKPMCSNLGMCGGGCGCSAGPGCKPSFCGTVNHFQRHATHGCGGGCPGGNCGGHGCGHGGPALPGMNREDAVRYLEGMQYYPPYHSLRSPRDFFMFDVKYGIGGVQGDNYRR